MDALHEWELAQDQEVFDEQLRTGTYNGRTMDELIREVLLKERDRLKRPMPYYGFDAVSGSSYQFKLLPSKVVFQAENFLTKRAFTSESERPPQPFEVASSFSVSGSAFQALRKVDNGRFIRPDCSDCAFFFAYTTLGAVTKLQPHLGGEWLDLTSYAEWG